MLPLSDLHTVINLFDRTGEEDNSKGYYRSAVMRILNAILPHEFFDSRGNEQATKVYLQSFLQKTIPLITYTDLKTVPGTLSFFLLCKFRPNSFKFFFEMISRWLAPGRRLDVVLVYATDFRLSSITDEIYTVCEVMITIANESELLEIQRNFPIIRTEIALGIHSEYYANRILEIKGLTRDDKTALIQEYISLLVRRFPNHYDSDVFAEMQHVLITCSDEFKEERRARHLSRIICIQYFFRKALREGLKKKVHKRHVQLKIFRALLNTKGGAKKVLSFLVGVNLVREQENFGERNLIKAIRHFHPLVDPVEGSFFIQRLGLENICLSYIEIEKRDGSSFTSAEIRKLRKELPSSLKNRIEHRLHTVFMPRNEEEVMRNILTLTNQIKYVRDIPQVLITFEEQAYSHLYFTVILARILKPGAVSISDAFRSNDCIAEYLHDTTKLMGHIRKKYPKEATVFRLKLPKESFLRADQSIDLYKARQAVVADLRKAVGEVRDFNGGMISKQQELLSKIGGLLSDIKDCDEMLLENFFYSLSPVVARSLLDPEVFKTLFLMLLRGVREYKFEGFDLKFHEEEHYLLALIIVEEVSLKENIKRALHDLRFPPADLATASIKAYGYSCLGVICCSHDSNKRAIVKQSIHKHFAETANLLEGVFTRVGYLG